MQAAAPVERLQESLVGPEASLLCLTASPLPHAFSSTDHTPVQLLSHTDKPGVRQVQLRAWGSYKEAVGQGRAGEQSQSPASFA